MSFYSFFMVPLRVQGSSKGSSGFRVPLRRSFLGYYTSSGSFQGSIRV